MSSNIVKKDIEIETTGQAQELGSVLLKILERQDIQPERLEKFLDLQFKVEERMAERALNAALAEFQSRCPIVQRNKTGHNSKKYAPLEDLVEKIRGLLHETGLSFSFDIEPKDEKTNCMKTIIRHKFGGQFVSLYYFPRSDGSGNKNEAQGMRSANSYAKRTSLENALGIVTSDEDRDGGASMESPTENMISEIKALIIETKSDEKALLKFLRVASFEEMTVASAQTAIHALKQKRGKK